ncbi:MAG: DctP family TRAP transporter solute-binding subunit [Nitrospirae bacterium]|nr:DctP family TRAP transporter solute-binding subunit [Nitrospirota bacterium]
MLKKCLLFLLPIIFFASSSYAGYKSEYKLSVVVGPTGPWGEAAAKFASLVKERSGGRINIKPYYSGQLFSGKQTNEVLLLKMGIADFALGSTINWSTTIKELNLFSLPFMFSSYSELDAVLNGRVGKELAAIIEQKGVVALAWGENGFRELTNSKRKVTKPADLAGLKIRVVGSPIFIDIFKSLGANPVSINWSEALTSFQQGTVDGQENPINSVIIPYKLWQMQKNITVWHYAIDPIVFGAGKNTWNSFSQKDQEIILNAAKEVAAWQKAQARKGLDKIGESLNILRKNGMDVVVLSGKERDAFMGKTGHVYEKWQKEIGALLVDEAQKEIIKSRGK